MRFKVITLVAAAAAISAIVVVPAIGAGGAEQFKAKLKGDLEVPEKGDPDGKGRAEVKIKRQDGKICHKLFYQNIEEPTAAHIHKGAEGVAGKVIITLEDEAFETGSGGCLKGVRKRTLKKIEANPTKYYVNVHNAEYPDGAIRGQLTERP